MSESLIGGLIMALVAGLLWRSRGALTWESERKPVTLFTGGVVQRGRAMTASERKAYHDFRKSLTPSRPLPMTYRWKCPDGPAFIFVDTEDTAEAARAVALHPLFYPESVA